MQRVSIKSEPGDSYVLENREGPYSEDKRRRAERRWKRKEHILSEDLKQNRFVSATTVTVKGCGNMPFLADNNGHIVEDEVDKEYKMFLATCASQFDVESNSSDGVSNLDVDTINSSDKGDDSDPDYRTFLENLRKEGKSFITPVIVHKQLVYMRYEDEEKEEKDEDGETSDTVESQQSLETKGGPIDKRTGSDVSGVPKNNCDTELQYDDVDEDYQRFLNSQWIDDEGMMPAEVGSDFKRISSNVRNNIQVSNQAFSTSEVQCDIDEEVAGDAIKSQPNLESERGPFDRRLTSDVSRVPKDSHNTDMELDAVDEEYQIFLSSCRIDEEGDLDIDSADEDYQRFLDSYKIDSDNLEFAKVEIDLKGKSSSVRYNSQVSDQEFDNPKLQCDNDGPFLNSSRINDGNMVHMWDRNITKAYKGITKTYKGDDSSISSEPDLILLERNQIGENTPFVFSRKYDSSCFECETNPRDSRHLSSKDHSEFRRRLIKDLERPYNQEEYDEFLNEVKLKRERERHAETRQGPVKSYHIPGLTKSYLESFPDLAKAIAELKEPHKVLFLLRGFFFWLQLFRKTRREDQYRNWVIKHSAILSSGEEKEEDEDKDKDDGCSKRQSTSLTRETKTSLPHNQDMSQ